MSTSLEMLSQLRSELREAGIHLYLARVTDQVRDLFERSGFLEQLDGRLFRGVDSAVTAFLDTPHTGPVASDLRLVVEHE